MCECTSPARDGLLVPPSPLPRCRSQLVFAKPCALRSSRLEFHGLVLVAPSLHQQIENLASLVDGWPKARSAVTNDDGHLVEMRLRSGPMAPTAALSCERLSLVAPKRTRCRRRSIDQAKTHHVPHSANTRSRSTCEPTTSRTSRASSMRLRCRSISSAAPGPLPSRRASTTAT
jgi:hypothetical protein